MRPKTYATPVRSCRTRPTPPTPDHIEELVYDMREAALIMRVSSPTIRREADTGSLRSFRVGGRRLVSRQALLDFIEQREGVNNELLTSAAPDGPLDPTSGGA